MAEAAIAWQRRFDLDLVKLTPASTWPLRDYGVEDADDPQDALGRRRITRRVVARPDDWRRLPRLAPGDGFSRHILGAAARVRRAFPAVPVVLTVYAPASQAAKLAGPDLLAEHALRHPDSLAEGLRSIADNTCRMIAACADLGLDGVFLAVQTAQADLFTAEAYAGFALSGDRACLDAAMGMPLTILHLHGDKVHAGLFRNRGRALLHFDATPDNPAPESALAEGALSCGPSPWGAISGGGAAHALAESVGWLDRLKGPRFALSPGCTLPLATPAANIDALVAAARTPRPDRRI